MVSITVVPLNNLDLPEGLPLQFGPKFVLREFPEWLRKSKDALGDVDRNERQRLKIVKHALVSEYYADSYGFSDPEWPGPGERSIQDLRYQSAFLAASALWLRQPSSVSFTCAFHAVSHLNGRVHDPPIIMNTKTEGPYYAHPHDQHNPFQLKHAIHAAKICEILETVPRKTPVWAALRSLSAALLSYFPDYRYPLLWQALESLFTDEVKEWKVTQRLRDRISYFLADNPKDQEDIFQKVEVCYAMRSKMVHGRLSEWPEVELHMSHTEAIVRTAIRHILERPGMLAAFISPRRDEFLDAWVASQSFVPPPTPV
jgi:hypothetical protein